MSQAFRTTLLLGGLWLLVFLVGVYVVHFHLNAKEEKLMVKEKDIANDLAINEDIVANRLAIQEELEATISRWEQRSKQIPRLETAY